MSDFKQVQALTASVEDLRRFQGNVATKFTELDAPVSLPVVEVLSSVNVPSYTVQPQNVYVVVNARGGAIKIVLPVPNRTTQAVKILNGYTTGNRVSVVVADGGATFDLAVGESAEMVNTGRAWVRFGN